MRWDNSGQGLVEYALVIAYVVLAVIVAVTLPGAQVNGWFLQLVR